jgi:hypothetical protein
MGLDGLLQGLAVPVLVVLHTVYLEDNALYGSISQWEKCSNLLQYFTVFTVCVAIPHWFLSTTHS